MAGLLSRYFGFRERATDLSTEIRAGFTTFMVMAYIIFVNPIILGFTGVPGVASRGLTWPQAMTVVFLEGLVITVLVLTRFREAVMDAVPIALKRAISVGIGLFIAFIGLFSSGLVVKPASGPVPVGLGTLRGLPIAIFVIGFFLTAWLMARRMRGALLLGILGTTVIAIGLNELFAGGHGFATPGAARIPPAIVRLPD